jgi:lysozyme
MEKVTGTNGLNLIKKKEGFVSIPYKCQAGVPTIGYGSTYYDNGKKVTMSDPGITEQEATKLLSNTIKGFEKAVNTYVTSDINQNQFDALVSFTYNVGPDQFRKSTMLKYINKNPNDPNIALEFAKWVKVKGNVSKGLVKRRAEESKLYFL